MPKQTLFLAIAWAALTVMPEIPLSQHPSYGILDQKAPSWQVDEWFNLEEDDGRIDVSDFQGKVVYLFAFQSWCPGCHSHGFPTLRAVVEHFSDNDGVVFVAIQTVFEGFHVNTSDRAMSTVTQFDLDIPVGHDTGAGGGSAVMKRYRAGGTPWAVIVDRAGFVKFNGFSIRPEEAVSLINRLLEEPTSD